MAVPATPLSPPPPPPSFSTSVCVRVGVCVCVWVGGGGGDACVRILGVDLEGSWVLASTALVVV